MRRAIILVPEFLPLSIAKGAYFWCTDRLHAGNSATMSFAVTYPFCY